MEHKAELLHFTGGNVGKLETVGVKRGASSLAGAKNLKAQTSESGSEPATLRTGLTCAFVLRVLAMCQEPEILDLFGIDSTAASPESRLPRRPRRVADASFPVRQEPCPC